jgi:hypothetical protein
MGSELEKMMSEETPPPVSVSPLVLRRSLCFLPRMKPHGFPGGLLQVIGGG